MTAQNEVSKTNETPSHRTTHTLKKKQFFLGGGFACVSLGIQTWALASIRVCKSFEF